MRHHVPCTSAPCAAHQSYRCIRISASNISVSSKKNLPCMLVIASVRCIIPSVSPSTVFPDVLVIWRAVNLVEPRHHAIPLRSHPCRLSPARPPARSLLRQHLPAAIGSTVPLPDPHADGCCEPPHCANGLRLDPRRAPGHFRDSALMPCCT
jgi:hypothetical protein